MRTQLLGAHHAYGLMLCAGESVVLGKEDFEGSTFLDIAGLGGGGAEGAGSGGRGQKWAPIHFWHLDELHQASGNEEG
jgi:hypothetical protein